MSLLSQPSFYPPHKKKIIKKQIPFQNVPKKCYKKYIVEKIKENKKYIEKKRGERIDTFCN